VRDRVNWFVYVGNNPLVMVDPSGLSSVIAEDISYNDRTGTISDRRLGSIRERVAIQIQRIPGHIQGNNESTLQITVQSNRETVVLYEADVQSWADLSSSDNRERGYTIPAGEYEGRLVGSTGSYTKPIELVSESLGVPANPDWPVLIHPNEMTLGRYAGYAWNSGGSMGCQVGQGGAEERARLTGAVESAGCRFGEGYRRYTDTVPVFIHDPFGITTTPSSREVIERGMMR
jgi:hypothetical protein